MIDLANNVFSKENLLFSSMSLTPHKLFVKRSKYDGYFVRFIANRSQMNSMLKEAAELFSHYGFRAIPVVDDQRRLIGVVPFRDVMNLTHYFI